ncbi:MAG: hypothetical protein IT204_16815 [Fimbriimonadaceae bacterium]|nr:hypothetical protein [Fimbriimonadaceae bacterium]
MLCEYRDFNEIAGAPFGVAWPQLAHLIAATPLFVKASQQAGQQGRLRFDPVATNRHLVAGLSGLGWQDRVQLPALVGPFGTAVDFALGGIVLEVQFSNYPFFANNVIRAAALWRARGTVADHPVAGLLVLAARGDLPSANSSLYYEQANRQLALLVDQGIVTVPVRLVGLGWAVGETTAILSTYADARSRTLHRSEQVRCRVTAVQRGFRIDRA